MVGNLLGSMIIKKVITPGDIFNFRHHSSIWGQRLAIVSLVLPLRKGFGDVNSHLNTIAFFASRREKMIVKAVSWALREGTKSHPELIREFIRQHENILHSSVLREVRNKLNSGLKNP